MVECIDRVLHLGPMYRALCAFNISLSNCCLDDHLRKLHNDILVLRPSWFCYDQVCSTCHHLALPTTIPSLKERMEPARDFHHPYTPYDIQKQLMEAIYTTLVSDYKVGLFELPTGTGKTLSIICSTMTWLRQMKRDESSSKSENSGADDSDDDEPDWVTEAYQSQQSQHQKSKIVEFEKFLTSLQDDYDAGTRHIEKSHAKKRFKQPLKTAVSEDEFLPEDYSEGDHKSTLVSETNARLAQEINLLLVKNSVATQSFESEEKTAKIYFCSRTHSQLNQFAHQLKITKFPSITDDIEERVKYIPLGSRKQLCINPSINNGKLGDMAINDACLNLQKKDNGCEFLPKNYLQDDLVNRFANLTVAQVHDIEELADMGENLKCCPYYTVRKAMDLTHDVISVPYQMMFSERTREALGIDLTDLVVVVDEAHNITDTICLLHLVLVTKHEFEQALKGLTVYLKKFMRRLNSGNRINLTKFIKFCLVVAKFFESSEASGVKEGQEVKVSQIVGGTNADIANVFNLETFMTKTKIAYKIEAYLDSREDEDANLRSPLLFKVVQFLRCINNPQLEGKFFWSRRADGTILLNYMLLDPSAVFEQVVSKALKVILCGGTMEPVADYYDYLFPHIPRNEVNVFKCGHIIPDENLSVFAISSYGPTNFDFSFLQRNNPQMINGLGQLINDLCKRVPHGLVVFFPLYAYLAKVLEVCSFVDCPKPLFKESLTTTSLESLLADYGIAANSSKGAILFAVVGGKLSEGINFNDNLARAVVMVGMPYANAFSGEIVAKRNYIENAIRAKGGTNAEAKAASQLFYENLCMRSINQSVGRCIRHAHDYATIYLVDQRYLQPRIQNKLSQWVKDRIESSDWQDKTDDFFAMVRE